MFFTLRMFLIISCSSLAKHWSTLSPTLSPQLLRSLNWNNYNCYFSVNIFKPVSSLLQTDLKRFLKLSDQIYHFNLYTLKLRVNSVVNVRLLLIHISIDIQRLRQTNFNVPLMLLNLLDPPPQLPA